MRAGGTDLDRTATAADGWATPYAALSDGWALREQQPGAGPGGELPREDQRVESRRKPDERILCRACRHELTTAAARITQAGRHLHTCVNPSGYVYRIACFRRAPGCVGVGAWSSFYSWFAGYSWQIACCGSCSMHLGWVFGPDGSAAELELFWGLIVDRITEVEADPHGAKGD